MKTAVSVLQEIMVALGGSPDYDCISQVGPSHASTFEYRCAARGVNVTAKASSKKEAKQEAAKLMLMALAKKGYSVPPPYGLLTAKPQAAVPNGGSKSPPLDIGPLSYVALLTDLCVQYRLPAVEYELVGASGPPHLRQFTYRARLCQHERCAVASTKKAARQQAAELLYDYVRKNLGQFVGVDISKEGSVTRTQEEIARAHERAMDRYLKTRNEPDVSSHLDIADQLAGKLSSWTLRSNPDGPEHRKVDKTVTLEESIKLEEKLREAASAAGLRLKFSSLKTESGQLCLLEMPPAAHTFAGRDRRAAVGNALRYLRTCTLQKKYL